MSIYINYQRYNIIRKLGQGGNGQVYQVLSEKDNKYYAIKTIPIDNISQNDFHLIENEAEILSQIDDIHIVKYYDSYKDKDTFNILMEYCEGSDLKKFINEHKDRNELISEDVIYPIVLDICLGIKEIHKRNLIHRDLKPENLFITKDNKVKIGDFGICKQLDFNNRYANTSVGTNNYMAPEVIKGESYNKKVDIWAFGCIIYELFTLNVCFESKNLYGFVDKIVNKKHGKIDLKKYNPKWQDLIDLLLIKNYNKRPDIDELYKKIIVINNKKNTEIDFKGNEKNRRTEKMIEPKRKKILRSKIIYNINI